MTMLEKQFKVGVKVGDFIKILRLDDPFGSDYVGRVGKVTNIDDALQIHGTWGGLALSKDYGDDWIIVGG